MILPSGAVSESRPAFLTSSRTWRTLVLSWLMVRSLDDLGLAHLGDLRFRVPELLQDFLGVLSQQGRGRDFGGAVRQLDRVANRDVLAALGMIDLDDRAGGAQRRFFGDFLHRQDRSAWDVVPVQDLHRLELRLGLGPLL